MKAIIFGLVLAMTTLTTNSYASERSLKKILKCTRNIVEKHRGGDEGIQFVGNVIENAGIEKNNEDALKSIHKVCRSFKKHHKKSAFIDRKYLDEKISNLNVSDATKSILKPFNTPYYDCKFRNIEAQIAIGIGVGVGLGAAKCAGTNGRRYILLIPQVSFNMGFIAGVFSRSAVIDDTNRVISLVSDAGYLAAGFFLAGLFDSGAELDQVGTGVGAGLAIGLGGQVRIKAIPLMNKFDLLLEQI